MPTYSLRINGRTRQVEGEPDDNLLAALRCELDLTGSKFGCGEGFCGACTVLMDDQAVRACVTRLSAIGGAAITTIEGLAPNGRLHPVQEAFLEAEAFQCGYCTPGMVMAVAGLLRNNAAPTDDDIARALDRNVCRCGTHPRIVHAIRLAAARLKSSEGAAADVVRR
jgi:aerobic-type carbon monoxide dehydrogenase small subunit (CoxS/CutS family)